MSERKLWVLKTVADVDRSLQTVDSYNDEVAKRYNYDSKVANFKQVKVGDYALIIDKKKILGFAEIETIETENGVKRINKCPQCGSSTIDLRSTKTPPYRCNKGHEFKRLNTIEVKITRFSAVYQNKYIPYSDQKVQLLDLRPFFLRNYNQNMSMQVLDFAALELFPQITPLLLEKHVQYRLPADEGWPLNEGEDENQYLKKETDERLVVLKQIKARRGQQKFRNDLRKRYGDKCMITGCAILDILEAAHINPYRGDNDNHFSNGLLLRADIHTLFDLDLIGINPDTLCIFIHTKLDETEYVQLVSRSLIIRGSKPDKNALNIRWKNFQAGNNISMPK